MFVKKYKPTLLLSQKIFNQIEDIKNYDNIFIYEDDIYLNGLRITCIKSSHDAIDARNFIFEEEGRGYIKPVEQFVTVEEAIKELECIKEV